MSFEGLRRVHCALSATVGLNIGLSAIETILSYSTRYLTANASGWMSSLDRGSLRHVGPRRQHPVTGSAAPERPGEAQPGFRILAGAISYLRMDPVDIARRQAGCNGEEREKHSAKESDAATGLPSAGDIRFHPSTPLRG
jgi:hypothetical protein